MRTLRRADDVYAHASTILIASFYAAVGLTGATPTGRAFDIAVSGLNVLATQNHTPVSSSLASGQPGQEYYLLCGFTPTGSGGPSSVQFRFLVNGQVVRDVMAPVTGQFVAMGEFWTPPSAGTYTLVCEANPNKTFAETTYANNRQTKQFSVASLKLDPSAAIKAGALTPSGRGEEVSVDVAKELALMPDIRVQGLEIHSVLGNGTPTATVVTKGIPGETYYLHCVLEPVGELAVSSVRFVFRANGQIIRDVHAPVEAGTPVHMGWKWTPQNAGTHPLDCEANPQKTFAEATYQNNLKQALFPVGPQVLLDPEIEAAPGRLPPGPLDRDEEEQPDEIILCPECFNPQPEPPGDPSPEGFHPDPPPPGDPRWDKVPDLRSGKSAQEDFEFELPAGPERAPGPQGLQPEQPGDPPDHGHEHIYDHNQPNDSKDVAEGRLARGPLPGRLPDLLSELAVQGGGVLFPLQILVRNESDNPASPSRVRVTWQLTCQKADGTSARSFPVGPENEVYSVPTIAPQQSYEVPGLTGPKQYCEAPPAAVRANLTCADNCVVRALADADGVVSESDEVNNAASVEVKLRK